MADDDMPVVPESLRSPGEDLAEGKAPIFPGGKTFNDLDARFQILSHHDPNHIFDEEYEMIKQLRERIPELADWSDKYIVCFLCARRHDMEETIKLVERHVAKAKELGFDKNPPGLKELQEWLEQGCNLRYPGAYDKHGRIVQYYWIAKDKNKERPIEHIYMQLFWENYYTMETEPLNHLRNGSIIVIDFTGFGWKNLDVSSKGKEVTNALSGLFPKRVRSMYIINSGMLLKAALSLAKFILPKKLMARLHTSSEKELRELIPSEHLLKQYGGTFDKDIAAWVEAIAKNEAKNKSGIKTHRRNGSSSLSPESAEKEQKGEKSEKKHKRDKSNGSDLLKPEKTNGHKREKSGSSDGSTSPRKAK